MNEYGRLEAAAGSVGARHSEYAVAENAWADADLRRRVTSGGYNAFRTPGGAASGQTLRYHAEVELVAPPLKPVAPRPHPMRHAPLRRVPELNRAPLSPALRVYTAAQQQREHYEARLASNYSSAR